MTMALAQALVSISELLLWGRKRCRLQMSGAGRGRKVPLEAASVLCDDLGKNAFWNPKIPSFPIRMPCWWLLRASCQPASSTSLGLDPRLKPSSLPVRPTVR